MKIRYDNYENEIKSLMCEKSYTEICAYLSLKYCIETDEYGLRQWAKRKGIKKQRIANWSYKNHGENRGTGKNIHKCPPLSKRIMIALTRRMR